MHSLVTLIRANVRSFLRDRAAMFWTLAFPLIFVVLFGSIFSGGNNQRSVGFADLDGSAAAAQLKAAFGSIDGVELVDGSEEDLVARMKKGEVSAVIVVPQGYADSVAAKTAPAAVRVYTDPSQSSADAATRQLVGFVLSAVNQAATGQPPAVRPEFQPIQTNDLTFISYLVPSILGMSLMQLGVFASIPLVADRQKLILKRLQATPLRRWQLVGSNVLMRLLIGALILLGSLAFIALGYVIASFAETEDAANGMTSAVQFPLMFLSGTFFPINAMPDALQTVARALPLTYLGDGLRQVMVDGTPFAPLWVCFAFLAVWLVVCFGIAARYFKWQ